MKNDTTELLIKILQEHGKDIYKDKKKFKSILLDFGVSRKEINLLIEITKAVYFKVFLESISKQNCDFEKVMLLNSVQDEYEFDEAYAVGGVNCWANALMGIGIGISGELTQPDASRRKIAAEAYYDVSQVAAASALEIKYENGSNILSNKTDSKFEEIYNTAKKNQSESDELFSKIAKIAVEENVFHNRVSHIQDKAKNGDSEARFLLAQMYETGDGVVQSFRESIKWYKMAAIIGNVDAVYRLGQIYEQGKFVPKNIDESIRWYKIAKEKGHSDGMRKLKQLRKEKSWLF